MIRGGHIDLSILGAMQVEMAPGVEIEELRAKTGCAISLLEGQS